MFAYTYLHVKNIFIRMDAQRNALEIKKSYEAQSLDIRLSQFGCIRSEAEKKIF